MTRCSVVFQTQKQAMELLSPVACVVGCGVASFRGHFGVNNWGRAPVAVMALSLLAPLQSMVSIASVQDNAVNNTKVKEDKKATAGASNVVKSEGVGGVRSKDKKKQEAPARITSYAVLARTLTSNRVNNRFDVWALCGAASMGVFSMLFSLPKQRLLTGVNGAILGLSFGMVFAELERRYDPQRYQQGDRFVWTMDYWNELHASITEKKPPVVTTSSTKSPPASPTPTLPLPLSSFLPPSSATPPRGN
jgi:hypothetical protein